MTCNSPSDFSLNDLRDNENRIFLTYLLPDKLIEYNNKLWNCSNQRIEGLDYACEKDSPQCDKCFCQDKILYAQKKVPLYISKTFCEIEKYLINRTIPNNLYINFLVTKIYNKPCNIIIPLIIQYLKEIQDKNLNITEYISQSDIQNACIICQKKNFSDCCLSNKNLSSNECGQYWGNSDVIGNCDVFMTNYCSDINNKDSINCACINSPFRPSPQCFDSRCSNSARAYRPVGPTRFDCKAKVLQCNIIFSVSGDNIKFLINGSKFINRCRLEGVSEIVAEDNNKDNNPNNPNEETSSQLGFDQPWIYLIIIIAIIILVICIVLPLILKKKKKKE